MYKVKISYYYRSLSFLFDDVYEATTFIRTVLEHYDRSDERESDKYEKMLVTIELPESEVKGDDVQTSES